MFHNYIHSNRLWGQLEDEQKSFSTTQDIRKGSGWDGQEGPRCSLVRTGTLRAVIHKWEGQHIHGGSPSQPEGRGVWPFPWALQTQSSCTREMIPPITVSFETQRGLCPGELEGCGETEISLLQGLHIKLLPPSPSTQVAAWKEPGPHTEEITGIKTGARGTGIWWHFLWGQKHWWVPNFFHTLSPSWLRAGMCHICPTPSTKLKPCTPSWCPLGPISLNPPVPTGPSKVALVPPPPPVTQP